MTATAPRQDPTSSEDVVTELRRLAPTDGAARPGERLAPGEEGWGVRMRDLFDLAEAHRDVTLDVVHGLLDHPAYEPRLTAFCILDFKARARLPDDERRRLYELYLERHDRITTWGMVDRAAPRVVGGHLAGRDLAPLHDLAAAAAPLRRRTAITAPLFFVRDGGDADLAGGFAIAARLAHDPEAVVHNAVGIYLKHAGRRDPTALRSFLDAHAATMPRKALRLAIEDLEPGERAGYLRT
jgi:hypothetical protein